MASLVGHRLVRVCERTLATWLVWTCLTSGPERSAFGYYCDHNFCQMSSQYCCGDNLCCDYVNQTLFNAIIVLIAIISAASILWLIFRIFCFSDAIIIIKKFGQRFVFHQNNVINNKWFEDTESSLLTDHLESNRG